MLCRSLLPCILLLAPVLDAQEMGPPEPAKQLAKLEALVGYFEGTGNMIPEAGAEKMPWTSRSSYEWGFGNHWLMEHTRITIPGMPALEFHGATGWDREKKTYIGLSGSNTGEIKRGEIDFVGDNKMISVETMVEEGNRIVITSVSVLGKDSFTFEAHRSVNGGKPHLHLEGTFKRVKKFEMTPVNAAFPMPRKIPELQIFAGMQGNYTLTGKMIPVPGAPSVPVTGKESVMFVGGGTMLIFQIKGDPMPGSEFAYEAMGALAWDAKRNCYSYAFVTNMGQAGFFDGFYDKDKKQLIFVHAGTQMGKPVAHRSVLQLDDAGSIRSTFTDAIHGGAKPTRDFEGEYKKIQ